MSTQPGDQAEATSNQSSRTEDSSDGELITVHCQSCQRELARILCGRVFCRLCREWTSSSEQEVER